MLSLILMILSFLCLLVGAAWNPPQVQLGWLGLALFVLTFLLKAGGA